MFANKFPLASMFLTCNVSLKQATKARKEREV